MERGINPGAAFDRHDGQPGCRSGRRVGCTTTTPRVIFNAR